MTALETDIAEQAMQWLALKAGGDFDAKQQKTLDAWLAASPDHAAAYAEGEALWAQLAWSPSLNARSLDLAAAPPIATPARRQKARSVPHWAAVAACLAVVCLAPFAIQRLTAGRALATEVGEIRHLALEDGSRVSLAGATRMKTLITDRARTVTLAEGDAYFDVAHDTARVFTVNLEGLKAEAVGTAFEVRATPAGPQVLVTEGKVRISARGAREVLLAGPGERVTLVGHDLRRARFDLTSAAAWRRQRLVFVDAPFSDVVVELNRYYAPGVVVERPALDGRRVTASFAVDQIPQALESMTREMGAHLERSPGKPDVVD
ncbi:FecR domain-containing protein [Caulobacter sp. RHG1]|uniref:FecR family protein n=1 Tax=Caulobacter sp. (strain RHG1) TaxID=2545762 RepID=UPI001554BE46|nr:FecR domain-containing protein [Caulobacter sp. RHG1]NQE60745.1 hypothetical protein [Caulobacter sp. RHG1]